MNNILFFYIGRSSMVRISEKQGRQNTFNHFYDSKSCLLLPEDNNTFFINYSDTEGLKGVISELMPIDQVFIITEIVDGLELLGQVKDILDKVLLVLKGVTFPLMMQKCGKVWLINNQGCNKKETNCELGAGLKAMIQVFAMEVAKKGINANYIQVESYIDKIQDVIEWGDSDLSFNFTSQSLVI